MGKSPAVESVRPDELTFEHVQSMGRQSGTFIAAALFEMGVAGNVSDHIEIMSKADPAIREEFREYVWLVLGQALDSGVAGMTRRNTLAHTMRAMHNDMLQQACVLAVDVDDSKPPDSEAVEMLEGLMRTAEQCKKAAEALYNGIHRTLKGFTTEGRRIMMMQEVARKAREHVEDQCHDEECDDPDCKTHTDH